LTAALSSVPFFSPLLATRTYTIMVEETKIVIDKVSRFEL